METVQPAIETAKGIGDYGMMAVAAAFFLIISAMMMIACFKWLKSIIENIMTSNSKQLQKLQESVNRNSEAMIDIAEGLVPETQLRIKNLSSVYFEVARYRVMAKIKRILTENHIADKESTHHKIVKLVRNLHMDRNSRFDNYTYRGKKLSDYCNPEWMDWVVELIEREIYNPAGPNDDRAFSNIKDTYERIQIDFYDRLQSK